MKLSRTYSTALTLGIILACSSLALGDDEDALAKAPPAVQAAVKAAIGSHKLAGFDPETDGGKIFYEVSYETTGGGDYTLLFDNTGAVTQREVEVDVSIIPPEIAAVAKTAHPDGDPKEYSIINAGGKLFYEIETKVGNDLHEVKISGSGKMISDTVAAPEAPKPATKPATPKQGN